jgi:DNA-binding beta-propeller fold protein YncE
MSGAIGTAFDGEALWVTCWPNTLNKVRPADGKVLKTFTVGDGPLGAAFDGVNIWVASQTDQTVSKVRVSDGKTVGRFKVANLP